MTIDLKEYIKLSRDERTNHLDLSEACLERGGNSTNHKGVLAQYLDTTIPNKSIHLAHACNNGKCSNPKHLYWATPKENIVEDGLKHGTWKPSNQRCLEKYGEEIYRKMLSNAAKGNKNGLGNLGTTKTAEHKRKISESIKKKYLARKLVDKG